MVLENGDSLINERNFSEKTNDGREVKKLSLFKNERKKE